MVTDEVEKMTITCLTVIRHFFDTIVVVSTIITSRSIDNLRISDGKYKTL